MTSDLAPEFALEDGRGIVFAQCNHRYLAAWPDKVLLSRLITRIADEARIELTLLPEGLRIRRTATHLFAFNYSTGSITFDLTGEVIDPASVSITALPL